MIHYIDSATKEDFEVAKNNPTSINNYFYKYVPYKEMLNERSKDSLYFKRLELWNDPWESFVLTGKYKIGKNDSAEYPLHKKVLATCFTGNYGSESQWHIYEQNESRIMLSYNKDKLIEVLEASITHFYIGKVRYHIPQPLIKKAIEGWAIEHIDYFKKSYEGVHYESDDYKMLLEPLLIKRKPFAYEEEYRFFIIDETDKQTYNMPIPNLGTAIGKVTLSPNYPKDLSNGGIEGKENEKQLLASFQEKQKEELRKYGFNNISSSSLRIEKNGTLFNLTKQILNAPKI